jgi:hypothetical protein
MPVTGGFFPTPPQEDKTIAAHNSERSPKEYTERMAKFFKGFTGQLQGLFA